MAEDHTLYELLARAAAEHAGRCAVEFGDRRMSYRDFHEAVDRLAGLLSEHGARPGARIAFCFRKSIDALVTMFAIIRTGAAYVPLDPAWPRERWAMICEDAAIELWTGTEPPRGIGGIKTSLTSTGVDGSMALANAAGQPRASGAAGEPAEGIANVLFTSGSTGRPKGVKITARSLLHFSQWVVDYFGVSADDRIANHAPYNFDLSTLDIFAAVRAGATMCPVPEQVKMFPYQMAKFIAERRISIWYSVPSALIMMQLRGKLGEHDLSGLRHVLFAGEVMPKPAAAALAAEIPRARHTNLYGPTETNVCTYYTLTQDDRADPGPVPIGWAIPQTRLWIADERGETALVGSGGGDASGELLVAGPTVTSGYLNDAELTARRLAAAPDGEGQAYRTGDRVHLRGDGALMFDGRIDRMIKCRGHRIEPGEIEALLAAHPSVKEAAIVALADPVFGNRIKACVSPRDGKTLDASELSAYCREKLPAYMLPDEWQFYEALPRTDREKVNLAALAR